MVPVATDQRWVASVVEVTRELLVARCHLQVATTLARRQKTTGPACGGSPPRSVRSRPGAEPTPSIEQRVRRGTRARHPSARLESVGIPHDSRLALAPRRLPRVPAAGRRGDQTVNVVTGDFLEKDDVGTTRQHVLEVIPRLAVRQGVAHIGRHDSHRVRRCGRRRDDALGRTSCRRCVRASVTDRRCPRRWPHRSGAPRSAGDTRSSFPPSRRSPAAGRGVRSARRSLQATPCGRTRSSGGPTPVLTWTSQGPDHG